MLGFKDQKEGDTAVLHVHVCEEVGEWKGCRQVSRQRSKVNLRYLFLLNHSAGCLLRQDPPLNLKLNSTQWAGKWAPPSHPPQMLRLPSHYFCLSVGTKDTYHIFMFSQQGLYRQRHFLRPCFVFKAWRILLKTLRCFLRWEDRAEALSRKACNACTRSLAVLSLCHDLKNATSKLHLIYCSRV